MKIDGFGGLSPLKKTPEDKRLDEKAGVAGDKPAGTEDGQDAVEISYEARLMQKVRNMPDVRADKIRRIKEEIASGTYITQEKLDAALEKLLQDLK